jgi:hypothetical protein
MCEERSADDVEPTPEELAQIAAEWPVIEAEMAVVAAECRLAIHRDPLSARAHRRAVVALAAVVREHDVASSYLVSVSSPDAA